MYWHDLSLDKRILLNSMPSIGMKVDSGPPSFPSVLNPFESMHYFVL